MTLKELKSKVSVRPTGIQNGEYIVTIYHHNKKYSCLSINSFAYERICESMFNKIGDKVEVYYHTLKAAYLAFYDECMAKNGLKK